MKYKDWLEEWLTLYVHPGVKEKTYQNYSNMVRLYILPQLGEYELENLSATALQQFIVELSQHGNIRTGKGLAASSVGLVITLLQKSLRFAVAIGKTPVQHTDHIQRPKIAEKKVECFSAAEQKKIEKAVLQKPESKQLGILLCLYTGLRIGELLALRWTDIDFQKGLLFVCQSCRDSYENGVFVKTTDTPKTASSTRVIPLPKQLVPYLKTLKKHSKSNYVVANGEKDISIRSYQKTFEVLLRNLGIPHKGFHALRHTFATRALECGMDVKTLSEILGHKNPNVTLSHYAHSMLEHKTAMMNKIGKLLQ